MGAHRELRGELGHTVCAACALRWPTPERLARSHSRTLASRAPQAAGHRRSPSTRAVRCVRCRMLRCLNVAAARGQFSANTTVRERLPQCHARSYGPRQPVRKPSCGVKHVRPIFEAGSEPASMSTRTGCANERSATRCTPRKGSSVTGCCRKTEQCEAMLRQGRALVVTSDTVGTVGKLLHRLKHAGIPIRAHRATPLLCVLGLCARKPTNLTLSVHPQQALHLACALQRN